MQVLVVWPLCERKSAGAAAKRASYSLTQSQTWKSFQSAKSARNFLPKRRDEKSWAASLSVSRCGAASKVIRRAEGEQKVYAFAFAAAGSIARVKIRLRMLRARPQSGKFGHRGVCVNVIDPAAARRMDALRAERAGAKLIKFIAPSPALVIAQRGRGFTTCAH